MQHRLALARHGRVAAVRSSTRTSIVAITGHEAPIELPSAAGPFAWVGAQLWWQSEDGRIERSQADGRRLEALALDEVTGVDRITAISATSALLCAADDRAWIATADGAVKALEKGRWLACLGERGVCAGERAVELRALARGRTVRLPVRGEALHAAFLFEGRAVAVVARQADEDVVVVATNAGQLLHAIPLGGRLRACAFAEQAGLAIAVGEGEVVAVDLRIGRVRCRAAASLEALAIDAGGRHLIVALAHDDVRFASFDEVFTTAATGPEREPPRDDIADESEPSEHGTDRHEQPPSSAGAPAPVADSPAVSPLAPLPVPTGPRPPTREEAKRHLDALAALVAARASLATCEARAASDDLPPTRARLAERASAFEAVTHELLDAGTVPPLHLLARELSLSALATQILACLAAPRANSQVARLVGELARVTDEASGGEAMLARLVEPEPEIDPAPEIARELAADAPLVRSGAVTVRVVHGERVVAVDDIVIDRLHGEERRELGPATALRTATCSLAEVVAPDLAKQELVLALESVRGDDPVRVVVRGRRGSGRHTLVAAAAAILRRAIATIDASRIEDGPGGLARELARARLAGVLPVVSGLEGCADTEQAPLIQHVIARHRGPVVVRTSIDAIVPVDPDRVEIVIPALTTTQRVAIWQRALARRDLTFSPDAIEMLGARYRFGAATIERVVEQVARRAARTQLPADELVEQVARQHVTGRLAAVATRVTRLARWHDVALVDEMRDSVLELIGRMRHQRKVYEDWGFEDRIGTARGLTALFYGPPGTGKTLVAGLVGRELGLEVWRIDLARVMSKWVGETQKKLAEVFDAAEDGNVLLLFDEADSLFAKRKTDTKSSNDHYANADTNYLLQRLDSFDGVAVLTTNLESAIDPAFKRRLTMRLYFPFPDAETRAELWRAHVPAHVPRAGELDFGELGETFPISGGYIRNCALRAAFLAAQEQRPLTQGHLLRALQLEYRELGKLWPSGRME